MRIPALASLAFVTAGATLLAAASMLFSVGHDAASPVDAAPQQSAVTITAMPILQFDLDAITVPAGEQVTVSFVNDEIGIPHNFAAYTDASASTPLAAGAVGAICTGTCQNTVVFTPSTAGTFYFQCDVHPFMNGSFTVQEPPAPTPTTGGGATETPTEPGGTPAPTTTGVAPPPTGQPGDGGLSNAWWIVVGSLLIGVALLGFGAATLRQAGREL